MEYNPRYAKLAEFIRENAHLMADGTLDKLYEEVRIHNLDWVPYLTLLMNSIGISPEDRLREIPKFFGYYINIPIHIPEGITAIGDLAYTGNPYQGELVIPGSVETIGEGSFEAVGEITNIKFNKGLKVIGDRSFSGTYGFDYVYIPDGCEIIGYGAFMQSIDLRHVSIPTSVKSIEMLAFGGLCDLTIEFRGPFSEFNKIDIHKDAFKYSDSVKVVLTDTEFMIKS